MEDQPLIATGGMSKPKRKRTHKAVLRQHDPGAIEVGRPGQQGWHPGHFSNCHFESAPGWPNIHRQGGLVSAVSICKAQFRACDYRTEADLWGVIGYGARRRSFKPTFR